MEVCDVVDSPAVPCDYSTSARPFAEMGAVMLSVYGDESADGKEERVFAVAGVMGWESDWQKAEAKWIERTGGEVFSAAKCEHQKKFDLYRDLTVILAENLGGYGAALDLAAFRRTFPQVPNLDQGFYGCFMRVVHLLTETATTHKESIEFTFHHRQKSEFNTGQLYDAIVNMPEWEANSFMSQTISFTSDKNPRIQMADLVARETMKGLDNQLLGFPPREYMKILCARGFKMHILGKEYCAGWKIETDNDPELAQLLADFLNKNRLIDNPSNRIRFIHWIQNRTLRSK